MEALKTFLKTTEALVVLGGLFLTVAFGKFWAILTAAAYVLLNVPNLIVWIREKVENVRF